MRRSSDGLHVLEILGQQLAVECTEEKQPVLDDRPAEGETEFRCVRGPFSGGVCLAGLRPCVVAAVDAAREKGAVEIVAAASSDQVEHGSSRKANFRFVPTGGDDLALQDLGAHVHAETPRGAEIGAHAVHQKGIGVQHGAIDHGLGLAAGRDAWRQIAMLHEAVGGEGQAL